jgi:hypothetical protein
LNFPVNALIFSNIENGDDYALNTLLKDEQIVTRKFYILAVLILLAVSSFDIKISAQAEGEKSQKKYVKKILNTKSVSPKRLSKTWVNLPSAPLIMEEYDSLMLLTNVSANKAVQYNLGCVAGEPQEFKVLSQHTPLRRSLAAYDPKNHTRESSIFVLPNDLLAACRKANARVAVTRVIFDGGKIWSGSRKPKGPAASAHIKAPSPVTIRIDKIDRSGEASEEAWLKISNNSASPVRFAANGIGRTTVMHELANGAHVSALAADSVFSPRYGIETPGPVEAYPGAGSVGTYTWLLPQNSATFRIPAKLLTEGKIFLDYKYDWEIKRLTEPNSTLPVHRTYLAPADARASGTLAGTMGFVDAQNKWADNAAKITVDLKHDGRTIPLTSDELGDYMTELGKGRYCLTSPRNSTGKPLSFAPGQYTCFEIAGDRTTRFDILLSGPGLSASASRPNEVEPCHNWHSRVDPTIARPNSDAFSPVSMSAVFAAPLKSDQPGEKPPAFGNLSQAEVFLGIECLLNLQGRNYDSRLVGATRPDVSQTFGATRTDVAALYYISYLFNQKWDFADAPFLQDGKGKINNDEAVSLAYERYRQWYSKVTALGLDEARKQKLDPLTGSGITWY